MKMRLLLTCASLNFWNVDAKAQTTLTLQPDAVAGKDAEVCYIVPDKNYGDSDKMSPYAWTQNGDLNIVRELIQFDLSAIPANATITSAKLSLYFNPYYTGVTQHNGDNAIWIQRVTTPWDEDKVTWNNQPSVTTTNQIGIVQSTSAKQNYPDLDVTELFNDILKSGTGNYGLMIKLQDETPYRNLLFASSDNTDQTIRPKLVITYTSTTDCITLQPDWESGKDAEVGYIVPNSNYGNSPKISPYAWTQNGDLNITRGLIQFSLTQIPANATITDAKLSLYYNPDYTPLTEHTGNNALWIRRITSQWNEGTVTWNTQPTISTTNQVSVPQSVSNKQDYPDIDVTLLTQDIFKNVANNYGMMIQLQDETPYNDVMLASSDHPNKNLHPKIIVCYTIPTDINKQVESVNSISIFPNPFSSFTTIQFDSPLINGELNVFNVQGQLVKTIRNISGNQIQLFRDDLKNGIYFIRVIQNNTLIVTNKIIID